MSLRHCLLGGAMALSVACATDLQAPSTLFVQVAANGEYDDPSVLEKSVTFATIQDAEDSKKEARPSLVAALIVPAVLPALLALGSAVCLLLMTAEGARVGRMYAADLAGACLGARGSLTTSRRRTGGW